MVSTRGKGSHQVGEGHLSDDEEERERGRGKASKEEEHHRDSRRRQDPVMREATKRGLDVELLHSSQTPAWGNLRGRSGRLKQASYFEGEEDEGDEIVDRGSDEEEEEEGRQGGSSEEEEGPSGSEEDEEGEGVVQPRYSRRQRQTVQRYSPRREAKPTRSGQRRRGRYDEDGLDVSDLDQYDPLRHQQHTAQFAERYSLRERRVVEFYNPAAAAAGSQDPAAGSGRPSRGGGGGQERDRERDRREQERERRDRGQKRSRHGAASPEGEEEEEEDRQQEEEEVEGQHPQEERKQYSFRDRALVTINPTLNLSQLTQGGGERHLGGHDRPAHKRLRSERRAGGHGSSRLRRVASRGQMGGRYGGEDEDDDIPDHPVSPWRAAKDGDRGQGMPGGAGAPSWEVALVAAQGLPLNQYGKEKGANAEITPLQVDPSVTFDTVGGLDHYIRALKEMIFLPLVYPELFERFHIAPPRGVLFYGPPGTGKTLVARALAAHASRGAGRRVSFFMRKGADVLSKWVGEAERQLRLLFEEAQRHQPSIIFFDEIDGLAPVRSSKQDQIHNSIVSTLLALMDGLDSRGQVVVIGATNRIDALDGALRRPGRFDRELLFPLPNLSARADILRIHTRKWAQPPSPHLVEELATLCVGYCGADLKSLCTEASLQALRRAYPQIYSSDDKLLVDPASVAVQARDFMAALRSITPASHRSAAAHARPLPPLVAPLLHDSLQQVLGQLQRSFPPMAASLATSSGGKKPAGASLPGNHFFPGTSSAAGGGLPWAAGAGVQRPRLLLCGREGAGQSHVGPAVLYALEGLPVHAIGLPSLLSDAGARSPEEALVHAVVEARRAVPAILFLPHLQLWWDTAPSSLRATLWMLLADLPPDLPLLLFATADLPAAELDSEARVLFGGVQSSGVFEVPTPTLDQRHAFFHDISRILALPPPPEVLAAASGKAAAGQEAAPPPLPKAPDAEAAQAAARKEAEERAARQRYEEEQAALRALRMALRDVLLRMLGSRKWEAFAEPVAPEEDPHYWDTVTQPMDLATLLARVDSRLYSTTHQFLADVALIPQGEREYWGVGPEGGSDPRGVREVSRACALEDDIRCQLAAKVPAELVARLDAMHAAGGPVPAPPGLAELMAAPPHFGGKTPGLGLQLAPGRPQSEGAAGSGRRATRLVQPSLDDRVVHTDPEAAARRIRMLKKAQEAAMAGATSSLQQAQQHDDEDLHNMLREEAGASAAAGPGPACHPQQQQQEEEDGAEEGGAAVSEREGGARGVLAATTKDNLLPERTPTAAAAAGALSGEAPDATVCAEAGAACEGQKQPCSGAAAATAVPLPAGPPPGQQPQVDTAAQAAGALAGAGSLRPASQQAEHIPEPSPADLARAEALQRALAGKTEGLVVEPLEGIHARLSRLSLERLLDDDREAVAQEALAVADSWLREHAAALV